MNESYPISDAPLGRKNGASGREEEEPFDVDINYDDESLLTRVGVGLADLGFIRAALRRGLRTLIVVGLIGFVAGIGYVKLRPPTDAASVTVLLPPATYPGEILDDQEIAQSRTVAGNALHQLKLQESPSTFLRDYTVLGPTDRILLFTVKATSSGLAVAEANALATAFLAFQAQLLRVQDQLVATSLARTIAQDQEHITLLTGEINSLAGSSPSSEQSSKLASLRAQRDQASEELATFKTGSLTEKVGMQNTTTTVIAGSRVLDRAVPVVPSHVKKLVEYSAIGLLAGLALAAGFIVVRALVSTRLRRRDDVAQALGAPVKLSVGSVRIGRGAVDQGATESIEIRRIVAHLGRAISPRSGEPVSLAVVAIGDATVAARAVVSLAIQFSERGLRVVLADLCAAGPAARHLGVDKAGLSDARTAKSKMLVVVPEPDDIAPAGPLRRGKRTAWSDSANEALISRCQSADLLLTLATLDPAAGADHLAGWARSAVVVVTAGMSSAEQIHSVGEMLRLAKIEDYSGVLLGADKTDASLGVPRSPDRDADPLQLAFSLTTAGTVQDRAER